MRSASWPDEQSLLKHLPPWVLEARCLVETDSTNRVALEWAAAGAPHACLVVADYQSEGKGRLGRRWLAPAGSSLLLSLILRPDADPGYLGLIGLGAGVALCRQLAGMGVEAALKWPNDVMLQTRKVAGILSEAAGGALVVGVGVNVNVAAFPDDLACEATSLMLQAGRSFDRVELLSGFLRHFGELYGNPAGIAPAYRRWSQTLGTRVRVVLAERAIEDQAIDIDGTGALVLGAGEVVRAADIVQLR